MLPRLVQAGYAVRRCVTSATRPEKQVYKITPSGERALRAWLEHAEPRSHDELLLKVFFGDSVDPAVALRHVRAMRVRYEAALAHFAGKLPVAEAWAGEHGGLKPLVLRAGIRSYEAWLALCDDAEDALRAQLAESRSS